jgi:LPXTG-site transpeptidase (sortase) family protein
MIRAALCGALLVLLLAGCGSNPGQQAPPLSPAASLPPATAPSVGPMSDSAYPVGIEVPAIHVNNQHLIKLGLASDGTVDTPSASDPSVGGWIRVDYGKPVSLEDPIVIGAHVDGDRIPGLFYKLKTVKAGDTVRLTMSDGTARTYTVTRTQKVSKDEFPTVAVYGQTVNPEIRLITCGGSLDRVHHNYRSSIIAYAVLTG